MFKVVYFLTYSLPQHYSSRRYNNAQIANYANESVTSRANSSGFFGQPIATFLIEVLATVAGCCQTTAAASPVKLLTPQHLPSVRLWNINLSRFAPRTMCSERWDMAKRPGTDDEMLNSSAESSSGDVNMETEDGAAAVSLEEILRLYNQPINEEQAWAVCYQCCRTLAQIQRRKSLKSAGASAIDCPRRIEGAGDVMIWRDGAVKLHLSGSAGKPSDSRQRLNHAFTGPKSLRAFPQRPYCCGCLLAAMWWICLQPPSAVVNNASQSSGGTADKPTGVAVCLQSGSVHTAESEW